MKRLIIVCEGPTENEFCLEMLAPILLKSDIYVAVSYTHLTLPTIGG